MQRYLPCFKTRAAIKSDVAGVNGTTFDDIDRYALDEYLQKVYFTPIEGFGDKAEQVLKNIHVLNRNGIPTLAGYLFFGKHPEYQCPGQVLYVSLPKIQTSNWRMMSMQKSLR